MTRKQVLTSARRAVSDDLTTSFRNFIVMWGADKHDFCPVMAATKDNFMETRIRKWEALGWCHVVYTAAVTLPRFKEPHSIEYKIIFTEVGKAIFEMSML